MSVPYTIIKITDKQDSAISDPIINQFGYITQMEIGKKFIFTLSKENKDCSFENVTDIKKLDEKYRSLSWKEPRTIPMLKVTTSTAIIWLVISWLIE